MTTLIWIAGIYVIIGLLFVGSFISWDRKQEEPAGIFGILACSVLVILTWPYTAVTFVKGVKQGWDEERNA